MSSVLHKKSEFITLLVIVFFKDRITYENLTSFVAFYRNDKTYCPLYIDQYRVSERKSLNTCGQRRAK